METRTVLNTEYTVIHTERGWKNDRFVSQLRGPKGAEYSLVEFDSGNFIITDMATGRSRKGKDLPVATTPDMYATADMYTTARTNFERCARDFVASLDRWYSTSAEDPNETYAAAMWLTNNSRNLSAYAGDMALAIHRMENRTQ